MSGDDDEDELVRRAQAMVGVVVKNKWTIERLIGVGGMAVVYQATHRNKKRAAIKMLHPEFSLEQRIRARFLREGYVANSVGHSGAVRVDDDDVTEDGTAFLVMELLEGETVEARRVRQEGRLSAEEALPMAHQLLDVLAAAHAKGIIHRDLKPDNLFLNRDGQLKVLDFGIARLHELRDGGVKTQTGSLLGTPAFMAPEQARGRHDLVDARTDLWAVGATLFTLLTGRFVHQANTLNEALALAVTQPPRRIASVVPDIHPLVAEVVDRALAFRPDERFFDARMMQEAIESAYSALSGSALPVRAVLPALAGGARTPVSLDVPIHVEPTALPASDVPAPPLRAPNPLLASAPAVTAGLRAPKASRRRSLLLGFALSLAALGAGAAVTMLVASRTPEHHAPPPSAAGKSENTSAPALSPVKLVPTREAVASLTLPEPQPGTASRAAPASSITPRARPGALRTTPSNPKPQAPPSPDRPEVAPAKASANPSADPFAKRR